MDTQTLKNDFYHSLKKGLESFRKTEQNNAIYAMALICDYSRGMILLGYNNKTRFKEMLSKFILYRNRYGLPIYGLYGNEYNVFEFEFIGYHVTELVDRFVDSCCYYSTGKYNGTGEPIEDIKNNYQELYLEMITETINRLKFELKTLGIDISDDFIFFYRDINHSIEEQNAMLLKTVDKELVEKASKMNDK